MAEHKTNFTHTDGYIAPVNGSNNKLTRSGNQVTSHNRGGGFFADEEEDEDIVTKIHHWQSNTRNVKAKRPQKHRELKELFSGSVAKGNPQPESDDTIPAASDDVQLNRLLDDYMVGEKGDEIMQQMEDLTVDGPLLLIPIAKAQNAVFSTDAHKQDTDKDSESSLDLNAMLSMEDFKKYIAEN